MRCQGTGTSACSMAFRVPSLWTGMAQPRLILTTAFRAAEQICDLDWGKCLWSAYENAPAACVCRPAKSGTATAYERRADPANESRADAMTVSSLRCYVT